MRVKTKRHVSFRGIYDTFEIVEATYVTKDVQSGKCWLNVDGEGFEMSQEEADEMIEEAFKTGVLDLSNYKKTNIPI